MIHPNTELRFISKEVGHGVVATEFIPKGTITWVHDKLDRIFTQAEFEAMPQLQREVIETYLFRNNKGSYVLCWDIGRYVNHSFKSNCLSTAYGFEIAICDIHPGEQLTDDYGYLNIIEPFTPTDEGTERKMVYPDDLLHFSEIWDEILKTVFTDIPNQNQPLKPLLSEAVWNDIVLISENKKEMESIKRLHYREIQYV